MNKGWLLQEIGRAVGASIRDTFNRQYAPGEGMCPLWLALATGLGMAAVVAFVAIMAWAVLS